MSLSRRDQKILWTKAGNHCSYRYKDEICDGELIVAKEEEVTLIGEECHLVGMDPKKPRYIKDYPKRETYENRILLCRNHHKMIDDNEEIYRIKVLQNMKKEHENSIADRIKSEKIKPLIIKDSVFNTVAKNVEEVIGMEINMPAEFQRVKVETKAENAKSVIGFKTNQPLTVISTTCDFCNFPLKVVALGPPPIRKICPKCGKENVM